MQKLTFTPAEHLRIKIYQIILDTTSVKGANKLPLSDEDIVLTEDYIHTVRFEHVCKCIDHLCKTQEERSKWKKYFKNNPVRIYRNESSISYLDKYKPTN